MSPFLARRVWPVAVAIALAFSIPLSARAMTTPALVVDVDSGAVLFAQDAGRPWYPASTTKLMTALVTFEALAAGEVTLETPVVMSKKAMRQESLHAGLSVGRAMRLEDALYAAFAASANDVAIALAQTVAGNETAFVARMNATAKRLGMNASHFANANGLFDSGQHVSARDLAILAMTIDKRFPQYRPIFGTSRVIVDGQAVDSFNALLTRYPGTVGMKTGFLCAAGRNIVALAERGGRRVMVVLLGATTDRERAERAAMLLTQAFAGELKPTGLSVGQIQDQPSQRPEDMRVRLCTSQSQAYEAKQARLYPMGIGSNPSYLDVPRAGHTRTIHTWAVNYPVDPPLPAAKPSTH
ncbi:D-alanyl-D-alanine carboxypeptidase family protein [Breoghania corrubedonensis]|uniref:D-alanyl-D-alanine carboxypeptidase family protein n=1 Tax=Breoghania corrubedonensis TaxID=665038 RepID=UPI001FEA2495|nr:D-alanyl-D-alanine carboxypeptidase family protein [Breoghania corrubedonensis]